MEPITPKERAGIAARAEIGDQYLYQCMTGRRDMDAVAAARVERESHGRIRRWQLRRDWFEVWPELVQLADAPAIATSAVTSGQAPAAQAA